MSDNISWLSAGGGVVVAAAALLCGCAEEPPLATVQGKVLHNGQPLEFGVVMFHPSRGQVAQAKINPDGTFSLSTFRASDGVLPGSYRVSVLCYEGHDPSGSGPREDEGGGVWLGKSLIPLKYTRANSSDLVATIASDGPQPEIVLNLE